jgi:protein-tyrosine phosphatase
VEFEADRLQRLAHDSLIPVRVLSGSEQLLTADLPARLRAGDVATLAGSAWVLVEIPMSSTWPSWFDQAIYALQLAGGWPILAHAERYPAVQGNPWLLSGAAAAGVLIQVNAGALLGRAGDSARHTAEQLLHMRLVHLLASDAHSPTHRPPLLAGAFVRAAAIGGYDYAAEIAANAMRVVAGESVTPGIPWLAPQPADSRFSRALRRWSRRSD